jgi:hypothetical protein
MKKLLIITVTLLSSLSSFAQNINVNTYYGTSNKLGVELSWSPNKITVGAGVSMDLKNGGVGTDYTGIIEPNKFSRDAINIVSKNDVGFYGIIGYEIVDNLTVNLILGYGTDRKYYNAYDNYKILSPNGYYFVSIEDVGNVMNGGYVNYKINKSVSISAGYDTFNKGRIGIGYSF